MYNDIENMPISTRFYSPYIFHFRVNILCLDEKNPSSTFMFLLFIFFQPCKCLTEKVKNKFEAFLAIVFDCCWSYNEIIVVTNFKS